MYSCSQIPEEDIWSPGVEVTGSCELWTSVLETKPRRSENINCSWLLSHLCSPLWQGSLTWALLLFQLHYTDGRGEISEMYTKEHLGNTPLCVVSTWRSEWKNEISFSLRKSLSLWGLFLIFNQARKHVFYEQC